MADEGESGLDIVADVRDRIGWVRIARPLQSNALRHESLLQLRAAVERHIADDDVRSIILTGEGKHFAAGADLTGLTRLPSMPAAQIKTQIYDAAQGAVRAVFECSKPIVAAINGAAITLGCELALACDFRVISPTARFQESWVRLGLVPPLAGLFLLPRIVGLAHASTMCLRGTPVGADEALRIGLAHELAPDDTLFEVAERLATELGALPPLGYAAVKQGLHRGLESSMAHEWAANVSTQAILLGTDDFREGLAAVRERRPPRFTGR